MELLVVLLEDPTLVRLSVVSSTMTDEQETAYRHLASYLMLMRADGCFEALCHDECREELYRLIDNTMEVP